ncbi:protein cortex [Chironomus tepperi]|uniref:protein cortex n=1 Tax=Chironomus tepperi TaxID=113505 RepID=UPI00391FC09B
MSSNFPKIPHVVGKNIVIGEDFDVMKKISMEKYSERVYKFPNDRYIPSKRANSEFLQESKEEDFDISLSENNLRTMKKVQYQNTLKFMFYDQQKANGNQDSNNKKNDQKNKSLIHLDWACKLTNIREKFLPDFETLEKKSFHRIHKYVWSSKNIIAASSNRKVCLYHPTNGYTRALDIYDSVTISFANSGDYLAMAYRKSRRGFLQDDIYLFQIDHDALFNSERLKTEKIRTPIAHDITALCFTQNDSYLMSGTNVGKIYVLECQQLASKSKSKFGDSTQPNWTYVTVLSNRHHHEIVKICFSASSRYMATLDIRGEFKIWNGGSWTYIFSYQHEDSRLYKHFEWHPYVENELIIGRVYLPAIFLFNVTERKVVASYTKTKNNWWLTSIAFNPVTAQLAVCFYNGDEYINRVCLLASMSQVISSFDFDYIEGGMKLIWNSNGLMLGAGAESFRFAFWSFYKNHDFHIQMSKASNTKNSEKFLTLSDSKLLNIR